MCHLVQTLNSRCVFCDGYEVGDIRNHNSHVITLVLVRLLTWAHLSGETTRFGGVSSDKSECTDRGPVTCKAEPSTDLVVLLHRSAMVRGVRCVVRRCCVGGKVLYRTWWCGFAPKSCACLVFTARVSATLTTCWCAVVVVLHTPLSAGDSLP